MTMLSTGKDRLACRAEPRRGSQGKDNLEKRLCRGIADGELRLYFQPLVTAQSRNCAGFEALVRWDHPVQGLLAPGAFLPAAEASSLIVPLSQWVLDEAVRQCTSWWATGQRMHVAVNLSAKLLSDEGLVEYVRTTVERHGASPQILTLEVTESALVERPDVAAGVLKELRREGFRLSVDDFGTGYTSLALLKKFEFDELKIDGSFVAAMLTSPTDSAIVHSILELGHRLGLGVVAECVEDEPTARRLSELGCDILQGYFFGKPAPAEEAIGAALTEPWAKDNHEEPRARACLPQRDLRALNELETSDRGTAEDFDDIAEVAAVVCGASSAFVRLVDECSPQAEVGFDGEVGRAPRREASCTHPILGSDVTEVQDVGSDSRLFGRPLAGDQNARFFAGAPLISDDGEVLGTLCVLDNKPRSLTPSQRRTLQRLAQVVVRRLCARSRETTLRCLSVSLMTLSQLHDPAESELAIDTIVSAGREFLRADGVCLLLAEAAGAVVFRALAASAGGVSTEELGFVVLDGRADAAVQWAMTQHQPTLVHVPDGTGSQPGSGLASRLGARSVFYVPVVNESGVIGFLTAWWRSGQIAIDPTRQEAAMLLATEAGTLFSRHQALRALRRAAETDQLTGLANRHYGMGTVRSLPPGSCLVLIDLDHFKAVNDRCGHQAGDGVLREFAAHLRAVATAEDMVARWGGEEFLVAVPTGGARSARAFLSRLRASWEPPTARTTFSAGAVVLGPTESPLAALCRADHALYKAKDAGRNNDHVVDQVSEKVASGWS